MINGWPVEKNHQPIKVVSDRYVRQAICIDIAHRQRFGPIISPTGYGKIVLLVWGQRSPLVLQVHAETAPSTMEDEGIAPTIRINVGNLNRPRAVKGGIGPRNP